ncbi:unnamed protein product [Acanthoscelides obtectus]|uniref:Tetraspanin n=1 Tax=Acanthoscelides obtectus TaxID=200917 RepID=A0A9P0M7L8_ACAOB|nr:unnamed protein product [Acanthoscelides obtectus]CAK1675214.1 CD63 antigen [Acanthoscelides obtectus]
MGCGETLIRCLNGVYIFYLLVAGIGLAVYGGITTYLILLTNSQQVIAEYGTVIPSVLTVILGTFLIIFICLGCCGICRESKGCLETYSAFLLLLALAHLAIGGYCVYTYQNSTEYTSSLRLQMALDVMKNVENYKSNPGAMDGVQFWFTCCGANGPSDYNRLGLRDLPHDNAYPGSCCTNGKICSRDAGDLHTTGCAELVYEFTQVTNIFLGYLSLAVGATEILAALLGICLSCCIWRKYRSHWR